VESGIVIGALAARKAVAALGVAAFAARALPATLLTRKTRPAIATLPRRSGAAGAFSSSGTSGKGTVAAGRSRSVARTPRAVCLLLAAPSVATAAFLGLAGEGGLTHGDLRDTVGPAACSQAGSLTVARSTLRGGFQAKFLSFRRIGHDEVPG